MILGLGEEMNDFWKGADRKGAAIGRLLLTTPQRNSAKCLGDDTALFPPVFGGPRSQGPWQAAGLPAMALWAGLLLVLRGFGSQLAVGVLSRNAVCFPRVTGGLQDTVESLFEDQPCWLACVLGEAGALCRGRGVHRREYIGYHVGTLEPP